MADTSIEWTSKVWNAVRGCTRVSPGCGQGKQGGCYAERMAYRFSGEGQPYEGLVQLTSGGPRWTGKVACIEEKLEEPLGWRKPQRIFVNSMSDLFHEAVPDEFISRMFAIMALCPQHTFQVLTKRPDRMAAYLAEMSTDPEAYCWTWATEWYFEGPRHWNPPQLQSKVWPLPNVWMGTSVEDQQRADERIPRLLQTPAAVRFVSYEPALGPVNFERAMRLPCPKCNGARVIFKADWKRENAHPCRECLDGTVPAGKFGGVVPGDFWIIVGGESGPNSRPFDPQWARDTIKFGHDHGASVFVKQLGAAPVGLRLKDKKGGDIEEWDADLRVRDFPETEAHRATA